MATKPRKKPVKTARRTPPSDSTMRLPHEQDESSRQSAQRPARVMRAAHDDVAQGKVDTDVRGDASRDAFNAPDDGGNAAPRPDRDGSKVK